jgi:hypothetical protein
MYGREFIAARDRKENMRKAAFAAIAFGALLSEPAAAQDTVKIGLVLPYSGQFADTAAQMDNAIKLFMQKNGDTVVGKKVEILRRDTGGIAPDVAKRLAQELVVRENVDLLAGWILSPNALSAAGVSEDSKKFDGSDKCCSGRSDNEIAVHRTHVRHPVLAQRAVRKLGSKERCKVAVQHGFRLQPRA